MEAVDRLELVLWFPVLYLCRDAMCVKRLELGASLCFTWIVRMGCVGWVFCSVLRRLGIYRL